MRFTKMHGCGNDYVYISCFSERVPQPEKLAVQIADRHKGVGGDGLILICPSEIADAKMRIFNLDGSEGKMCGNGIRCVAKYLYDSGIVHSSEMRIETLSGIKTCRILNSSGSVSMVSVDMGKAILEPKCIPVLLEGTRIVAQPHSFGGKEYKITCVSMGNPHCVVFCADTDSLDLAAEGVHFANDPIFPEGVNAEFVEILSTSHIKMRVWERGSGETCACGTGACAAAVAAVLGGYCKKGQDIRVTLKGGDLIINYTAERVQMTGEAVRVFDGVIEPASLLNTCIQ